ncbi:L-lysine 2-3-aminomutase [Penicillium chrysogenum]|uniref:L-lysine 2-3-aminomutase n=1 Tax=Penicillium chrysogenum TaxID=5076 RepID=A0ABQ8WAP1_PENCH|nr:L-lysine 2-3-aminomutase [Penicillium chrysogenum]XP_061071403.1 L-lysine 2-3-aminomutase [Penicillium rubens]KAJ5237925.1 L-lysine 2-3-aminomutase [Penicillium chrysogenum]KAJ5261817.1 L-lysine 2-3-aminomutase [Penicillium chrysogenum]KAJ5844364.1 L-lysine 2-3-aminomutase [Penicillium rubens]KAJ5845047.1 L-lysine 2-3-aminomutase [Penicillium rubens]
MGTVMWSLGDISKRLMSDMVWKIGLPVRSAVLKPHAGELVVGWVTTSESSLLYVFASIFLRISSNSASGISSGAD